MIAVTGATVAAPSRTCHAVCNERDGTSTIGGPSMRIHLRRTLFLFPLLAVPLGACNQSVDETSLADRAAPNTVPPLNQSCVDQLTRLAVRVMLQPDGDGVRLTILVGPDRLALSAFIIHSDLLALETDLAQAYTAVQYIDQTLGTASPMPAT